MQDRLAIFAGTRFVSSSKDVNGKYKYDKISRENPCLFFVRTYAGGFHVFIIFVRKILSKDNDKEVGKYPCNKSKSTYNKESDKGFRLYETKTKCCYNNKHEQCVS